MRNNKRNAKTRARKAYQSTEVRFSRHVWSTVEDDDQDDDDIGSSPVVGYSYQSFGGHFFFSLIRPSDGTTILEQLEAGRKLSTKMALHFSDEYVNVVTAILAYDDIAMTEKKDGFHIAAAACMHMRMQNPLLALAICHHLIRRRMSWDEFSVHCRIFSLDSEHDKLLGEIRTVWDEANSLEVMSRLEHQLTAKTTNKTNNTTIKI